MAQIRKYSGGDELPEGYTGRYFMNGRHLVGQQAIDRIAAAFSGAPVEERESQQMAQRAIQLGHDVYYNPDNTMSIISKDGKDITSEFSKTRASSRDSGFKKTFDATFNTKAHNLKLGMSRFANINMGADYDPSTGKTSLLTLNRNDGSFFGYDEKDGVRSYRIDDPDNLIKQDIISQIRTYLDSSPEERKRYLTTGWDKDAQTLVHAYDLQTEDQRKAIWNSISSHIKDPSKLTSADLWYLERMGFIDNWGKGDDSASFPTDGGWVKGGDWTGNKNSVKKWGVQLTWDPKIKHYRIGGSRFKDMDYYYVGDDEWAVGTPFQNGYKLGDILFTEEEALSGKSSFIDGLIDQDAIDAVSSFITDPDSDMPTDPDKPESPYETWYNRAILSPVHFYGERKEGETHYGPFGVAYNAKTGWNSTWNSHFKGREGTWNVADVTSIFQNTNDYKVIAYVGGKGTGYRNKSGVYTPRYVVKFPDGSIHEYGSIAEVEANTPLRSRGVSISMNGTFEVNRYESVPGSNRRFAFYSKLNTGEGGDALWIDDLGNFYIGKTDGSKKPVEPILLNPNDEYTLTMIKNPGGIDGVMYKNERIRAARAGKEDKNKVANGQNIFANKVSFKQWGGLLTPTRTSSTGKELNSVESTFDKAHKLNGTDGGLTTEEWVQIGAAVGDIVGMGLCTAPELATNVAGGLVGIGSSLADFGATVSREGKVSGKNVGALSANLLLDVGSMVPILGAAAKTSKVIRVFRGMGNVLVKLMALYGTAEGVAAAQKCLSGKEMTSEDLNTILRGFSSAMLVGHSMKTSVEDANLAKKLETTVNESLVKSASKELNTPIQVKKTKVGEDGAISEIAGTITRKELNEAMKDVKTPEKAVEILKEKFKLTDESVAEVVSSQLDVFKGRWNPFKMGADGKWHPFSKNPADVKVKGPDTSWTEDLSGSSAWSYFINPRLRWKMINQGLGKLDAKSFSAIRNAGLADGASRADRLAMQGLNRQAAWNPGLFGGDGSTFNGKGTLLVGEDGQYTPMERSRGWFGSQKRTRGLPVEKEAPVQTSSKGAIDTSKHGVAGDMIEKTKVDFQPPWKGKNPPQKRIEGETPLQITGSASREEKRKILMTLLEQVRVGDQDPWTAANIIASDAEFRNMAQQLGRKTMHHYFDAGAARQLGLDPNNIRYNSIEQQKIEQAILDFNYGYMKEGFDDFLKNGGRINKYGFGGAAGNALIANIPNLFDLANEKETEGSIRNVGANNLKSLNILGQRPFDSYDYKLGTYAPLNQIAHTYDTAKSTLYDFTLPTSDIKVAMAQNNLRAENAANIDIQKGTALTNQISAIDDKNLQAENLSGKARIDTSNLKGQYFANLYAQKPLSENETETNLMVNARQPYSLQVRQGIRQAWDTFGDFNLQAATKKAEQDWEARMKGTDAYGALMREYQSAKATYLKDHPGSTFDSPEVWLNTYRPEQMANIFKYDDTYYNKVIEAQKRRALWGTSPIAYTKHGGIVSSKSGSKVRPPMEQILIDDNRYNHKAAAKLSEDLRKTLLEIMKIK